MKLRGSSASVLAGFCLAAATAAPAHAAFVTYYLNQSNVLPLPDGVDYATVMIDDTLASTLTFTVSLLAPLTSIAGTNFGIQEFGFNVAGTPTTPLADASVTNSQWTLPVSWSAKVAPPNNQLNGFGRFEVSIGATGAGRLSPLSFALVNSGLTLGSFGELSTGGAGEGSTFFAAHIAGFDAGGGVTSAYFGGSSLGPTAVPLPASLPLLFAGMGLMGWMGRRRSN